MHGPLMIEKNETEKTFGDFVVREFKVTHTMVSFSASFTILIFYIRSHFPAMFLNYYLLE